MYVNSAGVSREGGCDTHFHTRTPYEHSELNTERQRQRQTDRQRGRQRDRQTDRDGDRKRQTDRQLTERERKREIGDTRENSLSSMVTDKHVCFLHPALAQTRTTLDPGIHIHRQTDRQIRDTNRWTDREITGRQKDRKRKKKEYEVQWKLKGPSQTSSADVTGTAKVTPTESRPR